MLSQAVDYTPIATWQSDARTYLIQVGTLQERPFSVFIAASGDSGSFDVMVPTEKDLGELIDFWNSQPVEKRTQAAEEALLAG